MKNKHIDDKPFFTLSVLAKYYYHCHGYRKAKITQLLTQFMEQCYQRYDCNKAMWDESIEKIAKNAGKYDLFEIDGVWITDAELRSIASIQNKVLERLAFTLLCIAKLGNLKNAKNNGWVNLSTKDIFNLARVSCTVSARYEKLGRLHELSLLEFPKRIDNLSCRVTYVDDSSKKKLFVSDFRELGYEYLKYKGDNYTRCEQCGILYRNSKTHPSSYCRGCRVYKAKEEKWITCVECGTELKIKAKNNRTSRCEDCQRIYRTNYQNELMRKRRGSVTC